MSNSYQCAICGRILAELPMSFAAEFPDRYANIKRDERDARAVVGSDQCIIDQQWFFIRGCLEVPMVSRSDAPFLWGLWVSVREEVFDEIEACWELQGREQRGGPFKGRLANSLAEYPESLNLRTTVLIQPVGSRPLFVIEKSDHPLTIEQSSGVTHDRALAMASLLLHQERSGFPDALKS